MNTRTMPDPPMLVTENHWVDLFRARLGTDAFGTAECEDIVSANLGSKSYRRGETIVHGGDRSEPMHLVVSGWAARVNLLEDGTHQITDFVLPGELCDLSRLTDGQTEDAVALTPVRVILLERTRILNAVEAHAKFGLALLRLALSEQAILREWLVCLGSREKREHLAHLLCELHQRLRRVGMVADHEFELPLTQDELAEAMGISTPHTNRVLQRLRKEGLISFGHGHLKIHQPGQLSDIAEFDGAYLQT